MRNSLFFIIVSLFLISCQPGTNQSAEEVDNRPNFVLILVDDLGFADIGNYGSEVATPNLDRLAENGVRFTQFHNTSKCFPSRASLLTGLYAQQVGMDRRPREIINGVTIGEVLKSAGYRTLAAGKHHGTENLYYRGFDRYYGLRDGASNHFNPGVQREGEPEPARKDRGPRAWCIDSVTYEPFTPEAKDFYTTDYFTKYAIDYLEDYRNDNQPFFLYLAYTAPHDPLMAWPEDIAKYEGKYDAGYEEIRKQRYQKQLEMGLINEEEYPLSASTFTPWNELEENQKEEEIRKMEVYAAMIDRLDQNIGKLLAKLEETGEADNTIIFFLSDNGGSAEVVGARSLIEGATEGPIGSIQRWSSLGPDWANVANTPYRYYKNYTHEGGTCTPLIVYWPQLEEGTNQFTEYTGHLIDFMPTLVELAEAEYPTEFNGNSVPPMEGESLVPVIKGEKDSRQKPIYWEWGRGKGVWNEGYKLVSDENSDWELYNMNENKTETNNLVEAEPEKVEEMVAMWDQWKTRMEDFKELTNVDEETGRAGSEDALSAELRR